MRFGHHGFTPRQSHSARLYCITPQAQKRPDEKYLKERASIAGTTNCSARNRHRDGSNTETTIFDAAARGWYSLNARLAVLLIYLNS